VSGDPIRLWMGPDQDLVYEPSEPGVWSARRLFRNHGLEGEWGGEKRSARHLPASEELPTPLPPDPYTVRQISFHPSGRHQLTVRSCPTHGRVAHWGCRSCNKRGLRTEAWFRTRVEV